MWGLIKNHVICLYKL